MYAVVVSGESIWSVHAAGLVMNDTWSNVAFSWSKEKGLDLFVNGKREAYVKYPEPLPPPPKQPLKPLQLTIGCRRVKKGMYEDFVQGNLDEFVTWMYKIPEESSHFFLGGLDPSKICKPATHPLRCSTDMRTLLRKINKMNLTDIDTAMTTIMHVNDVASSVTSKPKKSGESENSGKKNADGDRGKGGRGRKDKGREDGEDGKRTGETREDAGGKGVTSPGNSIGKGNGRDGDDYYDNTGEEGVTNENPDYDEEYDDQEEDEVDVEKLKLDNLRNMIAIVKKLVNKTSGSLNPGVNPEDLGVLYKMQEIVSTIFSEKQIGIWKAIQQQGEDGAEFTHVVQQWAMTKLMDTNTEDKNVDLVMISENIATQSAKRTSEEMKKKHKPYMYFPEYMKDPKWQEVRRKWNYPRDQLRVPTSIFNNSAEDVSIQSVLYETYHRIAPLQNSVTGANTSGVLLDSRVIGFEVRPSYNKEVLRTDPVVVFLEHYLEKTKEMRNHPREVLEEPKISKWECVRWSTNLAIPGRHQVGGWTTDGCRKVNSTTEYTTCMCDRLGMFSLLAVLERPKDYVEPEDEMWVFAVKGIGYSLSIIVLICYISAIAMRPSLHDQFHIIRLNLSVAAVGAMLSFFSVDFKRHDWEACRVLAGFIHYFYLAVGCWMTLLTHALFKGFIRGIVEGRVRFYLLIGWGVPLVVVGIVVASSPNYGYDDRCMVGPTREMRCCLACPLVFLGLSSLVWSTVICCNLTSPQIKRMEVVQELNFSTKMLFCLSLGFTLIWSIGIVALLELDPYNVGGWRRLFQIFNSWLGLIIVFFIGLGSRHFRYAVFDKYIKYIKKNQVNPSPLEYHNGYEFDYKWYYYD